jgi:hypothetical protein
VPELGKWIDATDLKPGQWLRTSAGTYVQVAAIKRWTSPGATVHNLTVSDAHTYYVLAGSTPVLVHNCGSVVLGVEEHSDALAAQLRGAGDAGAHTFNGPDYGGRDSAGVPAWMSGVMDSVRDESVTLSITLDGMPGAGSTAEGISAAFSRAVRQGRGFGIGPGQSLPGPGNGTAWEMSVVERSVRMGNRSWESIRWYSGGVRISGVANPFA